MVDFTREESWGVLYVFGIPVIDGLYAETVEQRTTWENRIPSLVRWASSVRWTLTWTTAEEYRDATGSRRYKPKNAIPGAQPAPSIMDAIIDDLQSQFDSEGITEHDSGDALIRLSDAIAAVEDNFVQPAPSVPDTYAAGINAVAAILQSKVDEYAKEHGHDDMGGLSFGPGMGGEIKMDYYTNLIELVDDVRAMLAGAPEAKP